MSHTTVFSPASLEGAFVRDIGYSIGTSSGADHSEIALSGSSNGTGTANFTFTNAFLVNLLAGLAYGLVDPGFSIIPAGCLITDIDVAIAAQADTYGVGTAYTWSAYWDNILLWSGAVPNGGPFSLGGTTGGLSLTRNGQSKLWGSPTGGSATFPFGWRINGSSTVPSIDGFAIQSVTVTLTWVYPVPEPPTPVTATETCESIRLDWTASAGPSPTFTIYRSLTSGSGFSSIATGVTGSTYTDSTGTLGLLYYYYITETTEGGTSAASVEVSGRFVTNIWWVLPNGTKKASCSQPACTMYPYDIVWEGVTYAAGTCMPWTLTTSPEDDSSYCAADDGSWYHGACPIVPKQWRLQQFSLKQRPEATS